MDTLTADLRLHARLRDDARVQVAATAVTLFLERGFEQTTADDVAAAAGISRSTFFRYFATKEDAALELFVDTGPQMLVRLQTRPPTEGVWRSLFEALAPRPEELPQRWQELITLLFNTPALRARHHERVVAWQEQLVPELTHRLGIEPSESDPRAAALVLSALGCVRAASQAWVVGESSASLRWLLWTAMDSVHPLED